MSVRESISIWVKSKLRSGAKIKNVLFLYLLLSIGLRVLIYYSDATRTYFDPWLGEGFFTSFIASFSEDMIFFGLIGLVVLIITVKKPEDHEFEQRIKSIANSNNVGEAPKLVLIESVKNLLAFDKKTDVFIVLEDFDAEKNAFKVFTSITSSIVNMCNDIPFPLISTKALVQPGIQVNGSTGSISYFGIREENNASNSKVEIGDGNPIFQLEKTRYERSIDFKIRADSCANWRLDFQIWSKVTSELEKTAWYYHSPERFSEDYNVTIENKCDFDVNLSYYEPVRQLLNGGTQMKKKVLMSTKKETICKSIKVEARNAFALHFQPKN